MGWYEERIGGDELELVAKDIDEAYDCNKEFVELTLIVMESHWRVLCGVDVLRDHSDCSVGT